MPKATTPSGDLIDLKECYIIIPVGTGFQKFTLSSLPEISDSKSAAYTDEPIIGRSFPLKTYSHSENRVISMQIHLFVRQKADVYFNLQILRALQSCTYPRNDKTGIGAPYIPPPICQIKCGRLLGDISLCVVLKSYSVKYPTDVPWDEDTYTPWKFDIDTNWEVVYKSSDLPGQDRILQLGV